MVRLAGQLSGLRASATSPSPKGLTVDHVLVRDERSAIGPPVSSNKDDPN